MTYFAFADGALGYDCAACGARCCRGWGLMPEARELEQLLAERPALALACRAGGEPDQTTLWNFAPACFFLDGAGCVLHRERGFHGKPFTCRWFPANHFLTLGDQLLVDLHPFCPIIPAGRTSLAHAELERELTRDEAVIRSRSHALELHTGLAAKHVLELEEACRDGVLGCADTLAAAALLASHAPRPADDPRADLAAFAASAAHFLSVDEAPVDEGLSTLLRLLSPSLRISLLSQLGFLTYESFCADFPRMLIALERMVGALAAAGHCAPTSETVRQIAAANVRLLWLLAHLDEIPRLAAVDLSDKRKVRIPRAQVRHVRRLLSFIAAHNERERLPLAELFGRLGFDSARSRIELLASLPDTALANLSFGS